MLTVRAEWEMVVYSELPSALFVESAVGVFGFGRDSAGDVSVSRKRDEIVRGTGALFAVVEEG